MANRAVVFTEERGELRREAAVNIILWQMMVDLFGYDMGEFAAQMRGKINDRR